MLDTLGTIYTRIGDYASAVTACQQAVERDLHHATLHYHLATSLLSAGNIAAAEIEVEACLAPVSTLLAGSSKLGATASANICPQSHRTLANAFVADRR
jgi:predicted Zn-dependent protease